MSVQALAQEQSQRRRHARYELKINCDLKSAQKTLRAATLNISEGGLCIKLQSFGTMDHGSVVAIEMEDFPLMNGTVVWVNNRIIGIEFIDEIREHPEVVALLASLKSR